MVSKIISLYERMTEWPAHRLVLGMLMAIGFYFFLESQHNRTRHELLQDSEIVELRKLKGQNDSLKNQLIELEHRHTRDLISQRERYEHEKDSIIRWVQSELIFIRKQHEIISKKMAN